MTMLNSILSRIGGIAADLADEVVPGADNVIEGAKALGRAFTSLKAANGGEAPADAEAKHDALLAKVRAHAESTLGRLENG